MKGFIIGMIIWTIICVFAGYQFKQSSTSTYLKDRKFILSEDRVNYASGKELTGQDIEYLTGKRVEGI